MLNKTHNKLFLVLECLTLLVICTSCETFSGQSYEVLPDTALGNRPVLEVLGVCQKLEKRRSQHTCAAGLYTTWIDVVQKRTPNASTAEIELKTHESVCRKFAKVIFHREIQGDGFRKDEMNFRSTCYTNLDRFRKNNSPTMAKDEITSPNHQIKIGILDSQEKAEGWQEDSAEKDN